jgi:hypothetical protein
MRVLKTFGLLGLCAVTVAIGCAKQTPKAGVAPSEATPAQFGPAPAKITLVNAEYRFVVIDFLGRVIPSVGTRLSVFRDGQRVGAVRVTEPMRSRFATADIEEGDLRAGDVAR